MQFTFWEEPPDDDSEDGDTASARRVGKAGEYITAAELELAGYHCSVASEGLPYDLIAGAPDGAIHRIQVKTVCRAKTSELPKGGTWRGYSFCKDRLRNGGTRKKRGLCEYEGIDAFAFVALDKRAVVFVRASAITTRSVSIPEKRFLNEHLRALSLEQALHGDV